MTTGGPQPVRTSVPEGDLARLLDTERRLEERLRAARTERDQVIAGAQAAAESRERAVATDLALEQRRLADGLEAERRQGEREIAAAAERQAAAFEGVPPGRVTAIARDLALRFFAGKTAP